MFLRIPAMIQSHISNVLIVLFSSLASKSQCFHNSLSALLWSAVIDFLKIYILYLSSRPIRLRYIYQNAIIYLYKKMTTKDLQKRDFLLTTYLTKLLVIIA